MSYYKKFTIAQTTLTSIQIEVSNYIDNLNLKSKKTQSLVFPIDKTVCPVLFQFIKDHANYKVKEARVYISYPEDSVIPRMTMDVSPTWSIPISGYVNSEYMFWLHHRHRVKLSDLEYSQRGLPEALITLQPHLVKDASVNVSDSLLIHANKMHSIHSNNVCMILHITWKSYDDNFENAMKPMIAV
jgi:hypothetical protein